MADDHLLDEIVLSVLNHTKSHDVQESVAVGVGHHGVRARHANQFLKDLAVQLGRRDVNGRLTGRVPDERARLAVLQQSIYHEGVAAQDGLIEREFAAGVNLRALLFHNHVQDAEVEIARMLK